MCIGKYSASEGGSDADFACLSACRAQAAAALSEGGRRRLSAHEEDLLRLAVEDRGLAEGPVMLTVSRIAEGNKGR